jgi:hypothetical protein
MASETIATMSADAPIERYRETERAFWDHYGLEPTERFIDLDSPAVRLRGLEAGSGEPLLFVHGTAGGGPVRAALIRELNFSTRDYKGLAADVLRGVLDALGLDRAHVVGNSIGVVSALALAARQAPGGSADWSGRPTRRRNP